MTFPIWWRLLSQQRFAVAPARVPLAFTITVTSLLNSLGAILERAIFERRAASLKIKRQPVFLIGHWRTGTTLLHELLALDEQFNVPNTYQCMQPHHFTYTETTVKRIFARLMPKRRPMDAMAAGFNRPQEDEFALANLGVPSPYLFWAFPNRPNLCEHYLDLEQLPAEEKRRWQDALLWFVKRLTLLDLRRLVLKSPTHTARIQLILDVFPSAKFVHIVRNPMDVVPSTIHTWRQLSAALSLQGRLNHDLEDYVLDAFVRMYRRFNEQQPLIPSDHYHEVRFEDLTAEPLAQLRQLYEKLSLGDFQHVQEPFAAYLHQTRNHKGNRHQVSDELEQKIRSHCADYSAAFGYL